MNELNKILRNIGDLQADIIDNIKPHIDHVTFKKINNQLNELKGVIYDTNIDQGSKNNTPFQEEFESGSIEIVRISDGLQHVFNSMLDDIKLHSHLMNKQQFNIAKKTLNKFI